VRDENRAEQKTAEHSRSRDHVPLAPCPNPELCHLCRTIAPRHLRYTLYMHACMRACMYACILTRTSTHAHAHMHCNMHCNSDTSKEEAGGRRHEASVHGAHAERHARRVSARAVGSGAPLGASVRGQ